MAMLRYGDVFERDCECVHPTCEHWRRKPAWKIWLAWFLRVLGWQGDPT